MKIIWLFLSLCLAVVYSESQTQSNLEADFGQDAFENFIEEFSNDLTDDEFSEFELQDDPEPETDNSEKVLNDLLSKYQQELSLQDDAEIGAFEDELTGLLSGLISGTIGSTNTVVLNGYVDRMFAHLRNIIAKDDFNQIPLPDEKVKSIKVHGGWLKDLCTIYRTDDVVVTLNTDAKKVTLQFPFKFDDLKIHYDFNAKVLKFVKTHGRIDGNVNEVKFNPVITFDYNTDTFTLDHFDMKHTGRVTVKISGHKVVDWMINALLKAATSIMHSHIVNEIQGKVGSALQKLIVRLDTDIHKKLHPNML